MRKLNKKIAIVTVVLLVLLTAAGYFAYKMFNKEEPGKKQITAQEAYNEAGKKSRLGDNAGALKQLDEAIAGESDSKLKAALHVEKANVQLIEGDKDGALKSAEVAAEADPSAYTFDFVARLYADRGDKQKAIEYYEKALDTFDKNSEGYDRRAQYINESLEALRS